LMSVITKVSRKIERIPRLIKLEDGIIVT